MSLVHPPFADGMLDRDAATRDTVELLRAAWADPTALLLRVRGTEVPVIVDERGGTRLAFVPTNADFTPVIDGRGIGHVYLGRMHSMPVFAVAVDPNDADDRFVEASGIAAALSETWRHPFEVGSELSAIECETIAVATALLRWHETAEFSPQDGEPTAPEMGGWARRETHGGELFPRIDPAVIVMIEHEDRILLGSNALWETGRFSLLAGFVEVGESLEQAVLREVYEEAGVRLEQVEYIASQPWPFPRSIMLGFRARLAAGSDPNDLRPDTEEISELRWFSREELRNPAPGIRLPMPLSISRWMIDRWIAERNDGDGKH